MFGYNDYGYGDYNHGRGYSSRSTTINAELQSQLEIKIKARTSSSQKMDFTFKPSMLVSSNLTGSASSSSSLYGQYGYSSSRSGSRSGSRSTIYLPITHLVSKIFPKYVKQYKLTLPANSSLIFIDEAEYQRYINYANGLIYPDEDVSVGKSQHHQLKSVYVIDDDVEMINQNISFIVNKLFNENRIISNITGRPELGSGLGPQPDRVNQEYYIETFFIPSAMSQQNKQIYTDAAVKIAEYLKEEKDLRSQIDTDKKGLASPSSNIMTPQDRTKLTIGIARKEMKRQKLIAQRVAYEYGQATNYNLQQLKSKEKKLTTDIKETNRIIANLDREVASSYDRTMHHDKSHYTQRLAQYKRELAETKSVLESMKLRMYLITITDMVLIPKILNNGKENPQFAVLYNQFISRDRTLGADAGRIGVGEESAWFMPTRAKCDAGKKEIESMYNEIVRDAMNTFRHEMIDNDSAHIGSEAISRATEKPPTEPGMIEKMKTAWMNMGKNNSAEYFKENQLDRAPSEDVFRATLESGEDPPESEDNKAVAALVRTKMGAYPVVFMLFGTPKLYRPTPSKTPSSSNIVNVVREPPQPKQDGGMKMKIQGLGLILNPTTVPPHFFTLKGDPAEYNKFKTVEIPYANVKIMDLTGTVDTAATPAVLVVPATPDAAPPAVLVVPVPVSDHVSGTVVGAAKSLNDIETHVKAESTRLNLTTGLEVVNTTLNKELNVNDEPLPIEDATSSEYQRMQSSGNENDCLVHSLLTALSPTFRTLDVNGKNTIASKFRREILVELYDKIIATKKTDIEKKESIKIKTELEGTVALDTVVAGQFGLEYHIGIFIRDRDKTDTTPTKWLFMGDDKALSFIILYNPNGHHYEAVRKSNTGIYIFSKAIFEKWLKEKIKSETKIVNCVYAENDSLYINETATEAEWTVSKRNFGDNVDVDNKCISLNVMNKTDFSEIMVPIEFFKLLTNGKKIFDFNSYSRNIADKTGSSGGSSTSSTKTRQVKINHKLKNNGTRRRRK